MKILVLLAMLIAMRVDAAVEYRAFDRPEQEQSYQTLINELRCLVCQNQSIADSNADLAKDLRGQVYDMLRQGQSEQAIVDFMAERYGDFVFYRPIFKAKTLLLWLGPVVFVVIGLIVVVVLIRQKKSVAEQTLSADEQARLSALLEDEVDQ